MKKATTERAVIVCTDKKGVFFGYAAGKISGRDITLRRARMCVYWSVETRGVLGLAAKRPRGVVMARQRATALEQQVYTLRARCVRLATWAIESGALDPGSLMPGDLATEYPELPAQGEGGG